MTCGASCSILLEQSCNLESVPQPQGSHHSPCTYCGRTFWGVGQGPRGLQRLVTLLFTTYMNNKLSESKSGSLCPHRPNRSGVGLLAAVCLIGTPVVLFVVSPAKTTS